MSRKVVKTECRTTIVSCDICGNDKTSMFVCEICKRDICNNCIIHSPNGRHLQICVQCDEQGRKLLMAENMEDKRIRETNDKFSKEWENIKEIVMNSNR